MQLRRGLSVLALGIICCAWPAFSQDNGQRSRSAIAVAQKEKAAPAKKTFSPRLPNGMGKLGITKQQREVIYNLQAVANGEIDVLEEKINAIKEKRDADIVAVLTPAQKEKYLAYLSDTKKKKTAKAKTAKPVASPEEPGADQ